MSTEKFPFFSPLERGHHKQLNRLDDDVYNPRIDALLDVCFIAHTMYRGDGPFSFDHKRSSLRASIIKPLHKSVMKLREGVRHLSTIGGHNTKRNSFKAIPSSQLTNAIYDAIKIEDNLFSCGQYNAGKTINTFVELDKNENTFLEELLGLSNNLLFILTKEKEFALTPPQKELIHKFLSALCYFLAEQHKLRNKTKLYCKTICESLRTVAAGEDRNLQNAISTFLERYDSLEKKEECFKLLLGYSDLIAKIGISLEQNGQTNKAVIEHFLDFYKESTLKKQSEYSLLFMEYLEQIDTLLKNNADACESFAANLKTFRAFNQLPLLWVQQCTRRELHAKEILKLLVFDDSNRIRAKECYKRISYISTRDNSVRACKEDGYVRPKELVTLLSEHLNKDQHYSLAYFLMHTKCKNHLKPAFLSFATKRDRAKQKLEFFKRMCGVLRKQPLLLQDLKEFGHYFIDDNPLELELSLLQAVQTAFKADMQEPFLQVQQIVSALIPAVKSVSRSLNEVLREFQQSYDIVDILLFVPEIKDKLGENKSLTALNQEDIKQLPQFWKEVFTDKESALSKFLAQKKREVTSSPNIPQTVITALANFLDTKMTAGQFTSTRNLIAKNLLEEEITRQIDALRNTNIFYDSCLEILQKNREKISIKILEEILLPEKGDQFFLSRYAGALLKMPYYLLEVLAQNILERNMKMGQILSDDFLLSLGVGNIFLTVQSLSALLSNESQQYDAQHPNQLLKIEESHSVLELFNLVNSRPHCTTYAGLGDKILERNSKENTVLGTKTSLNVEIKQKLVSKTGRDRRPRQHTEDAINEIRSPVRAVTEKKAESTVSCATKGNFQSLVENVEQKIAVEASSQWRVEKYIKSNAIVSRCDNVTACNSIEVYEDVDLVFTAEVKTKESMHNPPAVLPVEDLYITAYRHKKGDVAMAVSSMVESMRARGGNILDIKIAASASEEEVYELIEKYVGEALEQAVFPRVMLGNIILEATELERRLQIINWSLARKYQYKLEMNASQNNSGFFATLGQEESAVAVKTSAARALSFEV
ncbi:MAG: hypothetical protein K0R48_396 [Gammaproteobacteria bacterium]|jgi:hypothetical protein|nr:hypothetical protein [Gammaproteobacteria bacterium]